MAVKKKSVRKKTPAKKKGMSTGGKIAIGAVAVTGIYLVWDHFKKPKEDKSQLPPAYIPPADPAAILINAAQNTPANVVPDTDTKVRKLSPKGTAVNKQNWGVKLYFGDKGAEIETLQGLFNRISKLYGAPIIEVDGDWGGETEKKKQKMIGAVNGITLKQLYDYVMEVQQKKGAGQIVANVSRWFK